MAEGKEATLAAADDVPAMQTTAETASTPTDQPKPWTLAITTVSLMMGTFLIALDGLIIGTAIPTITSQFHSLDDVGWYGSAYLMTLTALGPLIGKTYKLGNPKVVYLICVAIFEDMTTVGSVICAAAPSSAVFILGRATAGVGAAGLFQGALNIVALTVPLQKRPMYMGLVTSVFGISVCIGPVIGGAFTQDVSWRWCFWINLPIGAVTFGLLLLFLKIDRKQDDNGPTTALQRIRRLDLPGAVAIFGSICCLFLALQWGGQTKPWSFVTIIGLLVGFALLLFAFCGLQYKMGEDATIPLWVLKKRSIFFGTINQTLAAMSQYVYGYYLPIYFQSIKDSTPERAGIDFMALALPQIGAIAIVGGIVTRWGYYLPYWLLGATINSIGAGLLTTLNVSTPTAQWAGYVFLTGFGAGMAVNLPFISLQVVLEDKDVPTGNAIAQFGYQLGAAIGLAVGQTLFINKLSSEVAERIPDLSPAGVVNAGARGLEGVARSPQEVEVLKEAYAVSVRQAFPFALIVLCVAFVFILGVENLNIKKTAKKRLEVKEEHDKAPEQQQESADAETEKGM